MNTYPFDEQKDLLRWQDVCYGASPLIYIHGLGCASTSDYPAVIASDAYCRRRSWLVDLPGAGFSDKPDATLYGTTAQAQTLESWILSTGVNRCGLFGHSAGAFIALKLAAALPNKVNKLILCQPGLSDYGIALLESITSMSESEFVAIGFSQLLERLGEDGDNEAWLGPFQICSPQAIYQWAGAALADYDAGAWIEALKMLRTPRKAVILSDNTPLNDIRLYHQAGCRVEIVAHRGHMIAYDNPDGLAQAISHLAC
ncbi:alpha/beta fold hydrolase [Pseudomonas sp. PDM19]|uniref:alpha/beta fold hydrolase n=1 Tax=Pseudomonas sp. PDM19 TaxID=2769272 RepID=UPI001782D06E|nr:alpha/beta hydrolase [Pseudomonas sp. PDM19]MBD9629236.1 alpha/beta hydrolase [Pseudomonas sp. PDM19]